MSPNRNISVFDKDLNFVEADPWIKIMHQDLLACRLREKAAVLQALQTNITMESHDLLYVTEL